MIHKGLLYRKDRSVSKTGLKGQRSRRDGEIVEFLTLYLVLFHRAPVPVQIIIQCEGCSTHPINLTTL